MADTRKIRFRFGRNVFQPALQGIAVLAIVAGIFDGRSALAQDAESNFQYVGYQGCADCHSKDPDIRRRLERDRSFSAMNEVIIFEHDKHVAAFELLKEPLGQQMERILQTSEAWAGRKVTAAQECLSCHSGWIKGHKKPDVYEYGVTCEACHGAASNWEAPHTRDTWRLMAPGVKEKKHNFIDVRNPLRRAEQCFSCHIGNAKEGKVVTHDMYAAGHPPLPGIEIENFISEMPSHWRGIREKGEFRHFAGYLKANFPGMGYDPLQDLPKTKSVMVGGVMALHESIELLADQSTDPSWPELAVFDCTACHHDLRSPAWRQTRGYSGLIPGRPGTLEWPNALIKLAINHRAGGDSTKFQAEWDAFAEKKQELTNALNAQPFGNSEGLKVAAGAMLPWLKQLANDIVMSSVQQPQAELAMKQLLSLGPRDYPDYHSARQILWAYRTIRSEVTTPYPTLKAKPAGEESLKATQDRGYENLQLFISWRNGPQAAGRQRVDELLKKLEVGETIRLELPATVDKKITDALPANLDAIGSYDPDWFREKLQMLAAESN
jgi:hypothetical protein